MYVEKVKKREKDSIRCMGWLDTRTGEIVPIFCWIQPKKAKRR